MFNFLNGIEKKSTKLIALGAMVLLAYLAMAIITSVVSYPTQSHRSVAAEMTRIAGDGFSEDYMTKIESPDYKALAATPQARYTATASIVSAIVSVVFNFVVTAFVYGYLRKYRVTKRAVGVTVAILMVSIIITFVVIAYAEAALIGYQIPDPILILGGLVFLVTFGTLVQYFVTRIVQWNYNRRHSLIIE